MDDRPADSGGQCPTNASAEGCDISGNPETNFDRRSLGSLILEIIYLFVSLA